jgi:hypothetical protein
MCRAWLVMLFSGLMGLAVPANALAIDTVTQDGVSGQAVFVINPPALLPWWVSLAFLAVISLLLGLAVAQLMAIKAALEKSSGKID